MDAQDVSMNDENPNKDLLQWPIHVEVRLTTTSNVRFDTIRELVQEHITADKHLILPSEITGWDTVQTLADNVERIAVSESACPHEILPTSQSELFIHVYQPSAEEPAEEMTNGSGSGDETMTASVCELPSCALEGLWDTLIYPNDVKSKLLNYIYATLYFSDVDVDFNIVSWNRVLLLHGPPGTGKTSLCRALAQKLSIRLGSRYSHSRLLEINSHSLFSRWFSESGKLVQKLFLSVNDLCDDEDCFVMVLIDEVESLTVARAGAINGTEPSDALRVVNALLTQLDRLRHKKNVLVMATSNLSKAIDSAFIDRADIIQFIDLPPREAIYDILRTCLVELMNKGLVASLEIPTASQAIMYSKAAKDLPTEFPSLLSIRERSNKAGLELLGLSERCCGMSGRSLRRLPVLAHASHIGLPLPRIAPVRVTMEGRQIKPWRKSAGKVRRDKGEGMQELAGPQTEVEQWLAAMSTVIALQRGERTRIDLL